MFVTILQVWLGKGWYVGWCWTLFLDMAAEGHLGLIAPRHGSHMILLRDYVSSAAASSGVATSSQTSARGGSFPGQVAKTDV